MNDTKMLDFLRRSRELLDRSYVKWTENDGKGGHCAVGAISEFAGICTASFNAIEKHLSVQAKVLHPELRGEVRARNIGLWMDNFDNMPVVFINNQLGKSAILAVFDAAILELELKLAIEPMPEPEAAAEPVEDLIPA